MPCYAGIICCFYGYLITYKNSTLQFNSFVEHSSLKNPALWLVWKFLDHNSCTSFSPVTWTFKNVRRSFALSYASKKKVHMNWLDFFQNPQNLIFGAFSWQFRLSWPVGTFFEKKGLFTFLILLLPNIMQIIRKKLRSHIWDLSLPTNEQTYTHRKLLLPWVTNHYLSKDNNAKAELFFSSNC